MDLTPDLLLEAKFAPARRGYDMNEVDDFLERCAEGLDVLLARLRAEFERAERAEAALAELRATGGAAQPVAEATADPERTVEVASPVEAQLEPAAPEPVVPDQARVQEPMRILIAAERTAEAAVADARAEAERIRAEAESVASTTRSEAETLLARSRAEAEAEARKAGEETRRSIEAEVLALRQDRDVLSQDVRSLRSWLDDQRGRLRAAAHELQRLVDDPDALAEMAAPEVHGDDELATGAAAAPPGPDGSAGVAPDVPAPIQQAPADQVDDAPTPATGDDVDDARTSDEVHAAFDGSIFTDEPTQAVPVVGAAAGGVFDDDQAPTTSALFGSDAIR